MLSLDCVLYCETSFNLRLLYLINSVLSSLNSDPSWVTLYRICNWKLIIKHFRVYSCCFQTSGVGKRRWRMVQVKSAILELLCTLSQQVLGLLLVDFWIQCSQLYQLFKNLLMKNHCRLQSKCHHKNEFSINGSNVDLFQRTCFCSSQC